MGFLMETDYQIRKLRPWSVSHHPRDLLQGPWLNGPRLLLQGPCATARGPLLERRETRFTHRLLVTGLVLLQQPVTDQ